VRTRSAACVPDLPPAGPLLRRCALIPGVRGVPSGSEWRSADPADGKGAAVVDHSVTQPLLQADRDGRRRTLVAHVPASPVRTGTPMMTATSVMTTRGPARDPHLPAAGRGGGSSPQDAAARTRTRPGDRIVEAQVSAESLPCEHRPRHARRGPSKLVLREAVQGWQVSYTDRRGREDATARSIAASTPSRMALRPREENVRPADRRLRWPSVRSGGPPGWSHGRGRCTQR
jgi:hypothetical protein